MSGGLKTWLDQRWPIWAARLLAFWSRLIRTRVAGQEETGRYPTVAYAHWHGDELALITRFGYLKVAILVSHSRDGEHMARAAASLGYRVTRGSSTRGAVGGLVALIREVKAGHSAVLAVDGPQGPRGVCKPGIVRLAQKTGVPLFPVGVAGTRRLVFKKSWNQAYLPLPFSRQVIFFGPPLFFPLSEVAEEMTDCCRRVEEALRSAREEAARILSDWA
ncbi:MAG: lysophospholipid acyltransferase family protein [Thermodesulfobacteriota bacterium]